MSLTIGDLIAIIAAVSALLVAFFKTRPEIRKLDGDAAKSYSEAAHNYASQVTDLQERLARAEKELATLTKLREENSDLREWAERLVHQVRSLGGEPVTLRIRHAEGK